MAEGSWQQHIDFVRSKGILAKKLYVIFTWPVDASSLTAVEAALPEHLAYQKRLEEQGTTFGAGPFADDTERSWSGEGMIIVRAESVAAAQAIAEQDPMHICGARKFRVRPWSLNEGSITISIRCSSGWREVI